MIEQPWLSGELFETEEGWFVDVRNREGILITQLPEDTNEEVQTRLGVIWSAKYNTCFYVSEAAAAAGLYVYLNDSGD